MDIPNIDAVSLIECVDRCLEKTKYLFGLFILLYIGGAGNTKGGQCDLRETPQSLHHPFSNDVFTDGRHHRKSQRYFGRFLLQQLRNPRNRHCNRYRYPCCLEKILFRRAKPGLYNPAYCHKKQLQRLRRVTKKLREEAPKMGQDDDYADLIAKDLLDSFDRSLADKRNERGGVYRAGTGTAMYYIFHSNQLRATPRRT